MNRSAEAAFHRFVKNNPAKRSNPSRKYKVYSEKFTPSYKLISKDWRKCIELAQNLLTELERSNGQVISLIDADFDSKPEIEKTVAADAAMWVKKQIAKTHEDWEWTIDKALRLDQGLIKEKEKNYIESEDYALLRKCSEHFYNFRHACDRFLEYYGKNEKISDLKVTVDLKQFRLFLDKAYQRANLYRHASETLDSIADAEYSEGKPMFNPMQLAWAVRIISNGLKLCESETANYESSYFYRAISGVSSMKAYFNQLAKEPDEFFSYSFIAHLVVDLQEQIDSLKHYFSVGEANDCRAIIDFDFKDMSPSFACEQLRKIEEKLVSASSEIYGNNMTGPRIGKPVIKFDDGHAWYRIPTRASQVIRPAMGHCGNTVTPHAGDEVWNLVKIGKSGKVKPALTFIVNFPKGPTAKNGDDGSDWQRIPEKHWNAEYKLDGGIIGEMKGRLNKIPDPAFLKHIIGLLSSKYIGFIWGGGHEPSKNWNIRIHQGHELYPLLKKVLEEKPELIEPEAYKEKFPNEYFEHLVQYASEEAGCDGEQGPNDSDYQDLNTHQYYDSLDDLFKYEDYPNAKKYYQILQDGYLEDTPGFNDSEVFDDFVSWLGRKDTRRYNELRNKIRETLESMELSKRDLNDALEFFTKDNWHQIFTHYLSNHELGESIGIAMSDAIRDATYSEIDSEYESFIRRLERDLPGSVHFSRDRKTNEIKSIEWDTSDTIEWSGGSTIDFSDYHQVMDFLRDNSQRSGDVDCGGQLEAEYDEATNMSQYVDDADDVDTVVDYDAILSSFIDHKILS